MDLEKRVEMLEKRIDKLESENMKERLTGLKVGDYFEVAGTKWRILDIKPCGYVCLSDVLEESRTFDSETNNWKSSSLRKYLNNDFYKKIADEIMEKNILPFGRDLLSLDGQNEYGDCTDYVSLLSVDDYRQYRTDMKRKYRLFRRPAASTTTIAAATTACARFVSFHLISLNRSDDNGK